MGRCIQHAALVWMTCMAGCDPAPSAPLLADAAPPEAGQPSDARRVLELVRGASE